MSNGFTLGWPVDSRTITQGFGENPHIYAKFNQAGHEGLDFAAPVGANVYASAAGEVFEIRPNDGNAYGLHVRVRHRLSGEEYRTIYAHLSQVLVQEGQRVQAGQVIGLAGMTGHTFAPHLHLTLKLVGAYTPGYPMGVIDPRPFLQETAQVEKPAPSNLVIYTTDRVRLRAAPTTASTQLAWLDAGEAVTVLGDADAAQAKLGRRGEWVHIQRSSGLDGFVAAWYTQLQPSTPEGPQPEPPASEPAEEAVVYATEALNVRNGPSTGTSRIAIALPHETLAVVGDWEAALAKVGDRSQWLQVRLPDGRRGYVAAWYVQLTAGQAPGNWLIVYPIERLNFRQRPTVKAKRIGQLAHNVPLVVHDTPSRARAQAGRYDEWLYVEAPTGERGWVAAWYVSTEPT